MMVLPHRITKVGLLHGGALYRMIQTKNVHQIGVSYGKYKKKYSFEIYRSFLVHIQYLRRFQCVVRGIWLLRIDSLWHWHTFVK